jgi:hypothetical protein
VSGLAKITRVADRLVQTPIADHRRVATDMGLKVAPDSVATDTPRRGPMTVG